MSIELRFFYSANLLIVIDICTKFHENILDNNKILERHNFNRKNSKRHKSVKKEGWLRFFNSAYRLIMVYICNKSHENILDGIKIKERVRFSKE